jgi:hypothetical protein
VLDEGSQPIGERPHGAQLPGEVALKLALVGVHELGVHMGDVLGQVAEQ